MWCDEVHHQLLVKDASMIKDAQTLDPVAYSDFISASVALWKRIQAPLYIPSTF